MNRFSVHYTPTGQRRVNIIDFVPDQVHRIQVEFYHRTKFIFGKVEAVTYKLTKDVHLLKNRRKKTAQKD